MSAVTPPVALAALVASKLAKDSYMRTAFIASRLAIPGFVLPFLFIYNPELLMLEGSIAMRLLFLVTVLLAFIALNVALSGTLFRGRMPISTRCLAGACAIGLIYPVVWIKLAAGLFLIIIGFKNAKSAREHDKPSQTAVID